MYSKTCTYRNALGFSGLDRFQFGQGFCFWRGTNNGITCTIDIRVNIQGASLVGLQIRWMCANKLIYYKTLF